MTNDSTISVIVPTYKREAVLVETLARLVRLLRQGDEILVIDQTPEPEPATTSAAAGRLIRFVPEARVTCFPGAANISTRA